MRILFFLYKFPVVSETFILNQIAYFIAKGCEVNIISVRPGDIDVEHSIVKDFDLMQRTTYLLGREPNNKLAKLVDRLLSLYSIFTNRRAIKSLNSKKYGYYSKTLMLPQILSKNHDQIESDVIISHFGTTAVLAQQLRSLGFIKGKLAAVFHGNDISQKRILRIFNNDYQELYQCADYIFPVSQLWADKIKSVSGRDDNIHVIRMGICVDKFIFKTKGNLGSPVRMLTIARLTEKKGVAVAIKACAILKEKNINFSYLIIGDGYLRKDLELLVTSMNLQNNIEFLGSQTQEAVSLYLNNADLFLLPSVTAADGDMEGIPVAIMEAMAMGIPVISTLHSGIPELIESGVSGFLVKEYDHIGIAKVILDLINDSSMLADICNSAKKTIDNNFDRDKSYSKMLSILSK